MLNFRIGVNKCVVQNKSVWNFNINKKIGGHDIPFGKINNKNKIFGFNPIHCHIFSFKNELCSRIYSYCQK